MGDLYTGITSTRSTSVGAESNLWVQYLLQPVLKAAIVYLPILPPLLPLRKVTCIMMELRVKACSVPDCHPCALAQIHSASVTQLKHWHKHLYYSNYQASKEHAHAEETNALVTGHANPNSRFSCSPFNRGSSCNPKSPGMWV